MGRFVFELQLRLMYRRILLQLEIPPQGPGFRRTQANTCGRIQPHTDWRGSTSVMYISNLGRKSGPMRTQANLCGRYFLVAEEGHMKNT